MGKRKNAAVIISTVIGALVLSYLVQVYYVESRSVGVNGGNNPEISERDWIGLDSKQQTKIVQQELNAIHYSGPITAEKITLELLKNSPTSNYGIDIAVGVELSDERLASVEQEIKQKPDEVKVSRLQQLLKTPPKLDYANEEQVKKEIDDLNKSIADAKAKQEKVASAPLKIINSYVDKDTIGTPQAHVVVQNVGNKTIDAYKVSIACFDSFGDPVSDGISNEYHGISQGITISPGETAGESKYWLLALQDTTTKIIPVITEVHFADGTTWSADN